MGLIDLLLIGIGLSMDAFAVAVCKGLAMPRLNMKQAAVIALFFGAFQALMPALGWALGTQFASFVTSVSHWIAFALLAFIGGKMLWDVFHGAENGEEEQQGMSVGTDDEKSAEEQEKIRARMQKFRQIPEDKGGLLRAMIYKEYAKKRYNNSK